MDNSDYSEQKLGVVQLGMKSIEDFLDKLNEIRMTKMDQKMAPG